MSNVSQKSSREIIVQDLDSGEKSTNSSVNLDSKAPTSLSNEDVEKCAPPPYSAFSKGRTTFILAIITLAGFLGPVSGNIYIPLLPLFQEVFNTSETTINGTVSVFMVTFGFAPLIWASYADYGGRKSLYIISLVFYIVACILLATLPVNIVALYILRLLQAFGASSVMSVGAGTVADMVEPKNRAKAISYFMLGPQLGPILGPILSIIGSRGNWRWIFGFLAIFGAVVYAIILFFLPETLRYLVGNHECYRNSSIMVRPKLVQPKLIDDNKKFPRPPKPSLRAYWKLLKYKPVSLCSINGGLLFATFYAISVTFAHVLKKQYHFSNTQTSISYICPGVSLISGSILGGRISDYLQKRLKESGSTQYIPEKRFSLQIAGLIISMLGVLGYGWCIDHNIHVVSVFAFTFLAGMGMTWVLLTNTTYLTECSTGQPASNVAIGNLMRNVAAAISSAIVEKLINKMGYGWCFTGLAFVDLISILIVVILMIYGPKWRAEYSQSTKP